MGPGACGSFIDDNTWGCAAPPQYPCGTHITFLINGKTWDVPVIDRGGAIQGSHFDLNYIVAKTTGFLSTGSGSAQFQVGSVPGAGTGSSKTGGTAGPATNSSGSIGPASNPVSDVLGTLGIAGLVIGLFALMLAFAFMI